MNDLLSEMLFAAKLADANDKSGIATLLYRAIAEITELRGGDSAVLAGDTEESDDIDEGFDRYESGNLGPS